MYIFDITNPITLVLLLVATVLLIFLGKEIKKPHAPAIALIFFLILVVVHSVQLAIIPEINYDANRSTLLGCLSLDLIMIFVTFFGYLWVDDIAAKFYKKKSIDNSLDWFWNKV
jgi:FtsH-binding integral membrane protein